jgi:hypothetical protein
MKESDVMGVIVSTDRAVCRRGERRHRRPGLGRARHPAGRCVGNSQEERGSLRAGRRYGRHGLLIIKRDEAGVAAERFLAALRSTDGIFDEDLPRILTLCAS